MKKLLLTGLTSIMAAITANGQQQTVFTQDFENIDSVNAQQWGAIDGDGDEVTFGFIPTQPVLVQLGFTGNVMGTTNFFLDDENNPVVVEGSDNILSPPIVTLPNEENLNLSFRLCGVGRTQNAVSAYQVYVIPASEFDSVTTIAEFVAIINANERIGEGVVNGVSFMASYDISAHQGEDVMVFIRHHGSTGATYLFVDDFSITSGLLATDEAIAASFSVYPNPTADFIRIENNNGIIVSAVTVTDANGRIVKTAAFNNENATIALDGLAAGSYFVKIATDHGDVMKQVIKK